MSLTDGDIALLARQAVDLLDPEVEVRIEPRDSNDPYRLAPGGWAVWPRLDPERLFGIRVSATETRTGALARLIEGLSEGAAESPRFWARVFPTCGEHPHAAVPRVEDDEVVVRCPETGEERARLLPATP